MYNSVYYDRSKYNIYLRDDEEGWTTIDYKPTYYKLDPNGSFLTLDKQRCSPTRKYSKDHLEIDVDRITSLLIELYKDTDSPPKWQNITFLDIEIKMGGRLTREYVWSAPMEVTAIAIYDATVEKYYCLVLDEEGTLEPIKEEGKVVLPFKSEKDLLKKFLEIWKECDPTILVGYNSDYFDIPYLYRRIKSLLGDKASKQLSPLGIVNERLDDEYQMVEIAGVASFDYMRLHKKYYLREEDSYSLDYIGTKYAKTGKIKYNGSLDRLFKEDIQKYIEYNLNDITILLNLDKKLKYIDLSIMICHIGHISYDNIYQASKINEGAILTYLKRKNIVSPNKPTTINPLLKEQVLEKTAGGFLKEPIPGLYQWVYDLDLVSLYPSIMRTLNMGYDTLVGRIVLENKKDCHWSLKELKSMDRSTQIQFELKDGSINSISIGKLIKFIENNSIRVSANGVLYDGSEQSVICEVLTDWFNKRVEFKNKMKDAKKKGDEKEEQLYQAYQLAVKVMLNSIYGCTALSSFRYGDGRRIIAGSITLTGQRIIQESIGFVNGLIQRELGTEDDYVIASDTDSMFIQSLPILKLRYPDIDLSNNDQVIPKVTEVANEYQKLVNDYYKILSKESFNVTGDCFFFMKMETIIKGGYWSKKRRYAQYIVSEEGIPVDKLDFKGLELMKSNFPGRFKEFGKDLIRRIILGEDKGVIDDMILEFKDKLGGSDIISISKPTGVDGLKKWTNRKSVGNEIFTSFKLGAPAHVKAAIRYNDLLRHFGLDKERSGIKDFDKIFWCNLKVNPFGIEALALTGYDDPEEILSFINEYIDKETVFNSTFLNKLSTVYSDLNWQFPTLNKHVKRFFHF